MNEMGNLDGRTKYYHVTGGSSARAYMLQEGKNKTLDAASVDDAW